MTLNLHLLGQFKLETQERLLELPSRPAQSLLAYLALNAGVTQRREKLASLLWPETSESNARSYLRQALWRIRKALDNASLNPDDYLQISDISITFNAQSDYWLDAELLLKQEVGHSVEELIETMRLYWGELLPGFYDEWVVSERERVQTKYQQNMNSLLDRLIQEKQWEAALKWGEEWIRLGYSPEPAYRALMRAHAGMGDQSMVSATYRRCVEALERELDIEPSPETKRLYEQILVGEKEPFPAAHVRKQVVHPPEFLSTEEVHKEDKLVFVAREHELEQLDNYLNLAFSGQGRVVFITGEAGSGKTALFQEFTRRVIESYPNLIVASGNCNAHTGIGDPYLPFREILGQLTGDVEARWAAGTVTQVHALKLWNSLPGAVQALVDVAPDLIDSFISGSALLERAEVYARSGADWLIDLEGIVQRKMTGTLIASPQQGEYFEQYTRLLLALSSDSLLVLLLDDLQWADSGSINLLFHLGRSMTKSRILILGAYRPEDVALGRNGERHPLERVVNELNREYGEHTMSMDQVEGFAFVEALLDSEPNRLGVDFREMLFRQTRGHPLFTIELLRGMQDRGELIQDQEGSWFEGPGLAWEIIPARVEAVIAERIGRLARPLQTILRAASVEGGTFTVQVLSRILDIEERELLAYLSAELDRKHHLVSAQSIQRMDGGLMSFYRFRHIITQRYLYSDLDEVERVYLHEQFGTELEALYGAQASATGGDIKPIAPQLARHFLEAHDTGKAINYLRQAGERAVLLAAYQEAISHLSKGLELLLTQVKTPDRDRRELQLQLVLAKAWTGSTAFPHPEVIKTYTRARNLCQELGEMSQLCLVLGELSLYHYVRAEYNQAFDLGVKAINVAQSLGDPHLIALGHWHLGIDKFALGSYLESLEHLNQVIDYYKPEEHHHEYVFQHGSDIGTSAMAYAACCLWCLGYPAQAAQYSKRALALAHEQGHSYSLADVLSYAGCMFNLMRREYEELAYLTEELVQLATQVGMAGWISSTHCFRGLVLTQQGEIEQGLDLIHEGIAAVRKISALLYIPVDMFSLAQAYAFAGQPGRGLSTIAEALNLIEQTDERHWESELHRLRGELKLMQGDGSTAEASFLKAIQLAQWQSAKSWELRATIDLARLWRDQGRVEDARTSLGEIYGWFTEGFDTSDLIEARALLEEMT